ncbi:helix-turn-helix domain-containing protein [Bacillus tropicus]|uniref:helix-turn-helix domain-containing protein n=1 Tax=Bacillus tropicus TaxID=2026188 RepID=UPI003D242814
MFLKRQYKLLNFISCERKWFSTKEIANHLNCSIKTVHRDILQIKDNLPEEWTIQFIKNKGVRLNKPLYASINTIQTIYYRHSLLFKTLNILLYQEINTIEQLSRKLYVQNTKMRSILLDIEHYLKRYELTLKKRPLRIEGTEINMILMYYKLYLKSYSSHEWPFKTLKKSMFTKILLEIEYVLNIKFYKESYRKLSFFIALYLIRKENRFNIVLRADIEAKIKESSDYKRIAPIITKNFENYNIETCNKDIIIIIIAINHAEYYCEKEEIKIKKYLSYVIEENDSLYNHLHELIHLLEQIFKIRLYYDENIIFLITCILQPYIYKSKIFIEKEFIKPTTIYMKNAHPKTFNTLTQIITNWLKDLNIQHPISENTIADLAMHIETINMQKLKKRKKVILFLNSGQIWERYLKAFLNSYFKMQLEYLIVSEENLLESYSECENIACIITDTVITNLIKEIPIILISTIPTKQDLKEIANLL